MKKGVVQVQLAYHSTNSGLRQLGGGKAVVVNAIRGSLGVSYLRVQNYNFMAPISAPIHENEQEVFYDIKKVVKV